MNGIELQKMFCPPLDKFVINSVIIGSVRITNNIVKTITTSVIAIQVATIPLI